MNDIGLSTRKTDPVARARTLGPAIAGVADEIERTQEIPEPVLTALHESRLFRMLLPRSVGGDQVEPWVYLDAIAEIARFDGSVGW
ncbi:MAG TPA: acyl-CoA dehydrogenase family protein, partial [Reyranella sp.]